MKRRADRRSTETVLTATEVATSMAAETRSTGAVPRAPKQRRKRR